MTNYNNVAPYILHYIDVIMTTMASQITSLTVVYSTVYSDANQRKHQNSASLAFVWGSHRDRGIPRTKGQWRGISIRWRHRGFNLFHDSKLQLCQRSTAVQAFDLKLDFKDFKDFIAVQNQQIHKCNTSIDITQFNCKQWSMNMMILIPSWFIF